VKLVYRLSCEVPEVGAMAGDWVVVRPGSSEPAAIVRRLDVEQLELLGPHLEEHGVAIRGSVSGESPSCSPSLPEPHPPHRPPRQRMQLLR